jgi:hypothetical protein
MCGIALRASHGSSAGPDNAEAKGKTETFFQNGASSRDQRAFKVNTLREVFDTPQGI